MPGQIVILNGAPRSGKSSIAAAMQARLDGVWINFGVDAAITTLPERYRPGIGLRPGGERPDLEPLVQRLYTAHFDAIAALSRQDVSIVADFGIHEGYTEPLGIWGDLRQRLTGLPLLTVGVFCPLDIIMARRNANPVGYVAGPGIPDPVRRWQDAVHLGHDYDFVVDNSQMTPAEAADLIGRRLTPSS
jgi:chloramphenicol 3-O phosphotransferase